MEHWRWQRRLRRHTKKLRDRKHETIGCTSMESRRTSRAQSKARSCIERKGATRLAGKPTIRKGATSERGRRLQARLVWRRGRSTFVDDCAERRPAAHHQQLAGRYDKGNRTCLLLTQMLVGGSAGQRNVTSKTSASKEGDWAANVIGANTNSPDCSAASSGRWCRRVSS